MNEAVYGIVNYAARYWLVALTALIVYRACVISVKEFRVVARFRKEIGSDGAPGRLVLIYDPGNRYEEGYEFPVAKECTIGRAGANDICVRQKSILRRHAYLELVQGGLRVRPEKDARVEIDGVRIGREGYVHEGEHFRLGDMDFRLVLAHVPSEDDDAREES